MKHEKHSRAKQITADSFYDTAVDSHLACQEIQWYTVISLPLEPIMTQLIPTHVFTVLCSLISTLILSSVSQLLFSYEILYSELFTSNLIIFI
jgi:hypothetical protein